jgi:hypothetical protein
MSQRAQMNSEVKSFGDPCGGIAPFSPGSGLKGAKIGMIWADSILWKFPSGERLDRRTPPVETKGGQASRLFLLHSSPGSAGQAGKMPAAPMFPKPHLRGKP